MKRKREELTSGKNPGVSNFLDSLQPPMKKRKVSDSTSGGNTRNTSTKFQIGSINPYKIRDMRIAEQMEEDDEDFIAIPNSIKNSVDGQNEKKTGRKLKSEMFPELSHNLNELILSSEQSLFGISRSLESTKQEIEKKDDYRVYIEKELSEKREFLEKSEKLRKILENCKDAFKSTHTQQKKKDELSAGNTSGINISEFYTNITSLRTTSLEFYKSNNISSTVVSVLLAHFSKTRVFIGLDLLSSQSYETVLKEHLDKWMTIISIRGRHRLISSLLISPLRDMVLTRWDHVKLHLPHLLQFLTHIKTKYLILSNAQNSPDEEFFRTQVFESILLPRIIEDIEQWNPESEQISDTLIFPLLPLFHRHFTASSQIYPKIRKKLRRFYSSKLGNLWVVNMSHLDRICVWKSVFDRNDFALFAHQSVLPVLGGYFDDHFVIPKIEDIQNIRTESNVKNTDPTELKKPFEIIFRWMSCCFGYEDDRFQLRVFSKFLGDLKRIVYHHLVRCQTSEEGYKEIQGFMEYWKNMFPPKLYMQPLIHKHFVSCEKMVSQRFSQQRVTDPDLEMAAREDMEAREGRGSREGQGYGGMGKGRGRKMPTTVTKMSFKDAVIEYASRRGIEMTPKLSMRNRGKQVYRFGKALIFIHEEAIFMRDRNMNFRPVSIFELVEICNGVGK